MDENKVKIGPRILGEEALGKLLPSSKNIENEINIIRTNAQYSTEMMKKSKNSEDFSGDFKRDCNNIFSILGVRGAGKTTVLLTLHKRVDKKEDIILPLIVPEKMGDVTDVLGCIIGLFGDVVEKLNNEFYKVRENEDKPFEGFEKYFKDCRKINNNPLQEKYKELLKQYFYTKTDYRTVLLDQYNGFSDYIENASNILDSDQKLLVRFEDFIGEVLKVKREINGDTKNKEPLIYLFFDDVDLSDERCSEVLNIILRYLSNDNIVVFLAGDEDTFLEVLTIDSLKKHGLLSEEKDSKFYGEKTALDCRKDLSKEFLKKVMPPAFRYYMPYMSEKAKAEFVFSIEDSNISSENEYPTLLKLIEEIYVNTNDDSKKNFLFYNDKLLHQYFKIFDQTPRGIINVYYFLYSEKKSKENIKQYTFALSLKRFIETLVQSSAVLSKYDDHINQIIDIRENIKDSYIDYQYIGNMDIKETKNSMDKLVIFMLAHFIENIIAIKDKDNKRDVHGAEVLGKILNKKINNKVNEYFKLYPRINDVNLLLYMHELILAKIPRQNIEEIEENTYYLGKYIEILNEIIQSKKNTSYQFFWNIYREDKLWVDQIIEKIMEHGAGPITKLKKHADSVSRSFRDMKLNDDIVKDIDSGLKQLIEDAHFRQNEIKVGRQRYKNITKFLSGGIASIESMKKIIEVYEDEILDIEYKLKSAEVVYFVTAELKTIISNLMESSFYKNYIREYNGVLWKIIPELLERHYISEKDYKRLLKNIENDDINPRVRDASAFHEIYYQIQSLPKELPDELWHDNNLSNKEMFSRLKTESIQYVKAKTYIDIEEDLNKKEKLSNVFEETKSDLLNSSSNSFGFRRYLARKDEESRMVMLNV